MDGMMNYQESQIQGSTWTRCRAVTVVNPHASTGQTPMAYFQEEKAIAFDNTVLLSDRGSCGVEFDAAATVTMLDPQTGQPTGQTFTHADLYRMMFSLYMDAAKKRDETDA
jgi:hypothetical protein